MTERKPREVTFTSWIDQQISAAAARGAFDDLPGAGKPLQTRGQDSGLAWLRVDLRRENVPAEDLLPTPLRLRKQVQRLTETVQDFRAEADLREAVAELNRQIIEWRRIPLGPPVVLPLVDEDAMAARWRDTRPAALRPPAAVTGPGRSGSPRPSRSPRWWRRLTRRPG